MWVQDSCSPKQFVFLFFLFLGSSDITFKALWVFSAVNVLLFLALNSSTTA